MKAIETNAITAGVHEELAVMIGGGAIQREASAGERQRRDAHRVHGRVVPFATHAIVALLCCMVLFPSQAHGTWWESLFGGGQTEGGNEPSEETEVVGETVAPTLPDSSFAPTATTLSPTILIFSEVPSVYQEEIANLSGDLLPTVMERLGTPAPTPEPTPLPPPPTPNPTLQPTEMPSPSPSQIPSSAPNLGPSSSPSDLPSQSPTSSPSVFPSLSPTIGPSSEPTLVTSSPIEVPTTEPTFKPTNKPSDAPSGEPSGPPSDEPTLVPTDAPFEEPSIAPSKTPSAIPSAMPSHPPSSVPSTPPSPGPSVAPTPKPTKGGRAPVSDIEPTQGLESARGTPTAVPTAEPTKEKNKNRNNGNKKDSPSPEPTKEKNRNRNKDEEADDPTLEPTKEKKNKNKDEETNGPTPEPTKEKKNKNKDEETDAPTPEPTKEKNKNKNKDKNTDAPSPEPTKKQKNKNKDKDTDIPTIAPSSEPTGKPVTAQPPNLLQATPSARPSVMPSVIELPPSNSPSESPVSSPTSAPASSPTYSPSSIPTLSPSFPPIPPVPVFTEVYTMSVSMTLNPLKEMSPATVLIWQSLTNLHIRDFILDTETVTEPTVWTKLRTQNETIVDERFLLTTELAKSRFLQTDTTFLEVTFDAFIQFKTSIPINVADFITGAFGAESAPNYVATLQGADSATFADLETVGVEVLVVEGPFATGQPTPEPSTKPEVPVPPTILPTNAPTTDAPTTVTPTFVSPTISPSQLPSLSPSSTPSFEPVSPPSATPSTSPNAIPTTMPSVEPVGFPSAKPSDAPNVTPSTIPTNMPSTQPSPSPSELPSVSPSAFLPNQVSSVPTTSPSLALQVTPTSGPVEPPTDSPSSLPTTSASPTAPPTDQLEGVEQIFRATASMTMTGVTEMSLNDVAVWDPLTERHILDYAQKAYGSELSLLRIQTEFGNQTNAPGRRQLQTEFEFWFFVNITFTAARRNLNVSDFVVGGFSTEEGAQKYISLLHQIPSSSFSPLSDVGVSVMKVEDLNEVPGENDGDTNGQRELPPPSSGSSNNTWIYIVAAVGGLCLIALIFLFGYLRQSSSSAPPNGAASQTAASKTVDDRVTAVVDVRRDDVSTLSDPHLFPGSSSFAGGKMSVAESPSVAGSADYDYAVAYGDPSDFSSVSTSDHQSKLGGMSFVSEQISQSEFTGGGFSTYGKTVGSSTLLSDDASFREQYVMEGTEQRVEVVAPRGLLGIVIDTPRGSIPTVYAIKETSILADQVRVGDKLISVDGEDTTALSAAKILQMLSERSENEKRVLVFMRPNAGDNASQHP